MPTVNSWFITPFDRFDRLGAWLALPHSRWSPSVCRPTCNVKVSPGVPKYISRSPDDSLWVSTVLTLPFYISPKEADSSHVQPRPITLPLRPKAPFPKDLLSRQWMIWNDSYLGQVSASTLTFQRVMVLCTLLHHF